MKFGKYYFLNFFQFYLLRSDIFLKIYFICFKIKRLLISNSRQRLKIFLKKINSLNEQNLNEGYVINNSNISFNNIDHLFFTCEVLNYFKKFNLKPFIFQSNQYRSELNKIDFLADNPLIWYSEINNSELNKLTNELINKTLVDIIHYKYMDVSCGKYALSTTMRMLRVSEINLEKSDHKSCLKYNLKKSIAYTDASQNFLNKFNVKYALFNDRGYTGEGELYDLCIKNDIICIQFIATYKNNSILFKKLNKHNKSTHPSSISDEVWNKFGSRKLSLKQYEYLKKEIKESYTNNTWYPSAGTMVGKNLENVNQIIDEIGIKNKKKNAVIFPHIFWDGTFFYGEDLFSGYEKWYEETLKYAEKNRKINWIIKAHPSNQTKNIQDNAKENKFEPEYRKIIQLFGKVPENFYYISSKSKINTFYLLNMLDYCITVRGTVAIEAGMRGKVVITAGTGRYDNKGFTNNFIGLMLL